MGVQSLLLQFLDTKFHDTGHMLLAYTLLNNNLPRREFGAKLQINMKAIIIKQSIINEIKIKRGSFIYVFLF